ncbi:hypothetical protein V8E54_011189 [Elaphomyces granulatus]
MEEAQSLLEVPRSKPDLLSPQELPTPPLFFTPRSTLNGSVRTSRQALAVLSCLNINRLGPAFTKASQVSESGLPDNPPLDIVVRTPSKKRKLSFSSPAGSPQQSSPLRKVRAAATQHAGRELQMTVRELEIGALIWTEDLKPKGTVKEILPAKPLRRSVVLRTCGELCLRSIAGAQAARVNLQSICDAGWQDQISNFYSRPNDMHSCVNLAGDHLTLPFCTASCNTNSLIAVGDEEGGVGLLDSAKGDKKGFSRAYLSFRLHLNAIMDLEFSSDDKLLATASGDQTTLVLDLATQKPVYCLSNHVSSVKRVRFQPASNNKRQDAGFRTKSIVLPYPRSKDESATTSHGMSDVGSNATTASRQRQNQSKRDEAIRRKMEADLNKKRHNLQRPRHNAKLLSELQALQIKPNTTVAEAAQLMAAKREDCVLVTDNDHRIAGIFTAKDLAFRVVGAGLKAREVTIAEIMTKNPLCARTDTSATDALDLMVRKDFRHLLVMDENQDISGILDITKCFYDAMEKLERAYSSSRKLYDALEGVQSELGASQPQQIIQYVEALRQKMSGPTLESVLDGLPPTTVSVRTSVKEAAAMMKEHHTTALLVQDQGYIHQ